MKNYDPLKPPDPEEWQSMDEQERLQRLHRRRSRQLALGRKVVADACALDHRTYVMSADRKGRPMRLPLIPPADLTPEQRSLYDAMRKGIASNFNAFKVEREDGALMGPWNPWLHEPGIGKAIWDLTLAMTANATLPDNVRQIAILVVGARFDAAYEIYAHIAVAEREGMTAERLATLVADVKPNDLAQDESVAFDVAYKLVRGGTLPEPLYRLAVETFGQHGTNELIYLVGLYSLVSTTLNGFNVPVPERE
jgi:4-carboxymuconolactone decarboxylase